MRQIWVNECMVIPQSRDNGFHHGEDGFAFGPSGRLPEYCFHSRNGLVVTNRAKQLQSDTRVTDRLSGRFAYFGPLAPTFGHFVAESIVRAWALAKTLNEAGQYDSVVMLPWANRRGIHTDPPKWANEVFAYLDIDNSVVYRCTSPTVFQELLIPEMGSELGVPAKSEYLRFLKSCQEKLPLEQSPISRKVFVSRRKVRPMQRVREISQVEEFLIGCGYQEFFPELASIATQLSVYAQATHLVFEAGSALHGLELLGDLQARVAVIRRSTSNGDYWKGIVEPRGGACFEFTKLAEVSSFKGTPQRGRSLALNVSEFNEFLYKHKFIN